MIRICCIFIVQSIAENVARFNFFPGFNNIFTFMFSIELCGKQTSY